MIDLLIVCAYFVIVFVTAITGKTSKDATTEEYFLSSRNLRWPSIAFSTIATNVQGYQFLGFMGSAYLYGLAQANFEINAIQGLLLAAFIFVPMYLRERIITITQFIKTRLGNTVALLYSASNILLFSTITLGAALFWGAYSVDLVFGDYLSFIHEDRLIRIAILIVFLGLFSATYTYFGGLAAVVRTDVIQFAILLSGGIVVLFIAVHHLGGWSQFYVKTEDLMHLHLPADHPKLPWIHVFGAFLLNINYWCANQSVVQRSLAAKSLKDVQIGLMVGGLMKYFMAAIIILPGIALVGILGDGGLADPDSAFPYLVNTYLPVGLKGLILCALFASLMSTVDSTFNSLATLWSIDIYKVYVNKSASDRQIVKSGKKAILISFISGVIIGIVLLIIKFEDTGAAFTHTLNELRYFVNCGIVVLISAAAFLIAPKHRVALFGFLATVPLQFFFIYAFPDMNYLVRAMWVILIGFTLVWLGSRSGFIKDKLRPEPASPMLGKAGIGMLLSLIALHIIFH
ncbi:sodium/solute symporter [Flavobacteriaceae bacterium 3-367]|uniref:SLC5 family protein n=1 Tax=Eudoraea algarum TaxID=3417568 RepID=UPI003293F939